MLFRSAAAGSPAFITLDGFSNTAGNPGGVFVARRFRGTANTPLPLQVGDIIGTYASTGFNGSNIRAGVSSARITFRASENFTTTSQAANTEFRNQVPGTGNDAFSIIVYSNGIVFPNAVQGGTGTAGITFTDGSFQNTAAISLFTGNTYNTLNIAYNTANAAYNYANTITSNGANLNYISTYLYGANTYLANTSASYVVPMGLQNDGALGITLDAPNNAFVFGKTSKYLLVYRIQLTNTDVTQDDVYVWVNQNGVNLANSTDIFTVPSKRSGTIPGKCVAVATQFITANASDNVRVFIASPQSSTINIQSYPATTGPNIPTTPGVTVTITEV